MSELIKSMLMSVVRKALVALGTYIVATGAFTAEQWEATAAGLTVAIVGTAWSLWIKYREDNNK